MTGDTLWSIAEYHGATVEELAEVNSLDNADTLATGQVLFIPAQRPTQAQTPTPAPEAPGGQPPLLGPVLSWPLEEGVLFSEFGPRQGAFHDGIDLGAPEGTPVLAAADGQVLFAGDNQGAFGNLVIVGHSDDRVTVYAHNDVNLVREGQGVRKGQVIARVGRTGNAQSPHVHFEVRQGRRPVNPVSLLPPE
jgi:murein DD-endopeptidase MepM/ murein hydrolase activator NlpD